MSDDAKPRPPAVLQLEFDRERANNSVAKYGRYIALECLDEVMEHGGTLVVVASPKTVTIVQRPDAEELS